MTYMHQSADDVRVRLLLDHPLLTDREEHWFGRAVRVMPFDLDTKADRGTASPAAGGACLVAVSCMTANAGVFLGSGARPAPPWRCTPPAVPCGPDRPSALCARLSMMSPTGRASAIRHPGVPVARPV